MNAPNNPTLYSISQDFLALEDLLEQQAAADSSDLDVVAKWLEELNGTLDAKLERCVAWSREQEALAEVRKQEAQRLLDLAKTNDNRVKRVKDAIKAIFEQQGFKKVDTKLGAVSLRANGGKAPLECQATVETAPKEFVRLVPTLDTEKIRAALEAGQELGFAKLMPRGSHIRMGV